MDSALIKKAKTDPDAFGELYEAFYDPLYRFIYLRVNDQALCEDLVSMVWEKVLAHLKTLKIDAPEAFRAWIFTIARNTITEHFRHHKEIPLPEDWDTTSPEKLQDELNGKELSEAITTILLGLPILERELVSLKIFAELSNKNIAEVSKLPERTVAAYLSRALKHVQKRLSFYSPDL